MKGLANGVPWVVNVHGEAVAVDLGDHGLLFALLTGPVDTDRGSGKKFYPDSPVTVLLAQLSDTGVGGMTSGNLASLSGRKDVVEVPPARLPMLVRFRDIEDPMTVEQVDPEDLAASFGPGVRLVRATLAITDDVPTFSIEQRLPWLKRLNGAHLTGNHYWSGSGLPDILHSGYFER